MTERSIFLDALDIPDPTNRAAFLDSKCGLDADLRQRVDALLAAHAAAGNFLEPPSPERTSVRPSTDLSVPAGPERTSVRSPADPMTPDRTGRAEGTPRPLGSASPEPPTGAAVGDIIAGKYKLVERLGEGGMGEVWLAEQSVPVRRTVALKLIRTGQDSRMMLARFEVERQALAMMDHPNIAKVLDAGATADGHPFFVMELVKGVPITEFCDARRLTPRQRLELFIPVCQAIQHAHQKGIIHRDIKPSNVLVALYDEKPVPKVIDFGVAKATGQSLTENTIHTAFQAVVGTLPYMSPEQATFNHLDIDTRSDVYSLGVLLYELLTGTTPVEKARFRAAAMLEMLRVVREEEPPRPSARLSTAEARASIAATRGIEPARLSKLLRGELDWIVMKSLEKDRARRYETATNLARDVERYLADEVVEARPPSVGYKARKFLRKHRGPVLAASLVLIALVAGIAGTTIGLIREAKQRVIAEQNEQAALVEKTRAEAARDRTREVLDAMTSEITGDSLATQKEITPEQKKFLVEVLSYYKEFAGEKGDDELSRKRTANSAFRVSFIEYRLGRKEESVVAIRRALDEFAALAAEFPAVPEYRANLAVSHNDLGLLLNDLGNRAEAEEQYHRALVIREKLVAEFPAVPEYRAELASSYGNLGLLRDGLGNRVEAEEHHRKALAIMDKLATEFPTVPRYRVRVASTHHNLGYLLNQLGKRAETQEQYRKTVAILENLATEFPAVPEYRANLATSHNSLGNLLLDLGRLVEAEEQYRKALAIQEKLAAEFPAVPSYRSELVSSHSNLGTLLNQSGKWTDAEVESRQAVAIQEKLAAEFPSDLKYRLELAMTHGNLGVLLAGLGKRAEAEDQYHKALVIQEKLVAQFPAVPEYHSQLAKRHSNLGNLLMDLGKRSEAEDQHRKALVIQEKLVAQFPTVPEYHSQLAMSHNNLGVLLLRFGRYVEAEVQHRQALTIRDKLVVQFPTVPEHRSNLAASYNNLGAVLNQLGKGAEGEEQFQQAQAIQEKLVGEFPAILKYRSDLAQTRHNLGVLLVGLRKWREAEEQYRKALAVRDNLAAEFPAVSDYRATLAQTHHNLGYLLVIVRKWAEAEDQYRKALAIRGKLAAQFPAVPEYRAGLASSYNNLGTLFMDQNKRAEAEEQHLKALAIREKLVAQYPTSPEYHVDLARTHNNLGLLYQLGKRAEAEEQYRKAVAIREKLVVQYPASPEYRADLPTSYSTLGNLLANLRRWSDAEEQFRKALAVQEKLADEFPSISEYRQRVITQLYFFASFCAFVSGKVANKKQEYADRAMELLQKAVKAGFKDAEQIAKNTDLASLRDRADFKLLLESLSKPKPKEKGQPARPLELAPPPRLVKR